MFAYDILKKERASYPLVKDSMVRATSTFIQRWTETIHSITRRRLHLRGRIQSRCRFRSAHHWSRGLLQRTPFSAHVMGYSHFMPHKAGNRRYSIALFFVHISRIRSRLAHFLYCIVTTCGYLLCRTPTIITIVLKTQNYYTRRKFQIKKYLPVF